MRRPYRHYHSLNHLNAYLALQGVVTRVKGFEQGLREALLTKGPMTVSVDASAQSFRFYKRGIYNNPSCHTVPVTGAN